MAYYNKKEASIYLRISSRSIYRFIKDPISPLPHHYVGNQLRFHKKDLDSWLRFKKPYKKLMRHQQEEVKIYG